MLLSGCHLHGTGGQTVDVTQPHRTGIAIWRRGYAITTEGNSVCFPDAKLFNVIYSSKNSNLSYLDLKNQPTNQTPKRQATMKRK